MSLPIDSALPDDLLDRTDHPLVGDENPGLHSFEEQTSPPQGAAESLATFFGSVAPQARRFAMSLVRCWNEAEELVQESFLRLAQRERQAECSATQLAARKGFLFTTIRNLAIDDHRKRMRRPRSSVDLDQLGSPQRSASAVDQNLQDIESVVEQTLEQMNRCWADALRLKLNGNLRYAEIADVLDATPAQIRGWIYRARQQLAQALEQNGLLGEDHE